MSDMMPVTLITGFLGAGKTTLIEHVFNSDTGTRWALIENEFGNVGVDGSVVNAPPSSVFELNDGCVCCTVRDDLINAFEHIRARSDEFDHILIETTGLAEPEPVIRLFDKPSVRGSFKLMGVITVVDAHHLVQSLKDVSACKEQIAFADLLILNKTEGVAERELIDTEEQLRHLNPLATLCRTNHAQIDVNQLLELKPNLLNMPLKVGHHHIVGHKHDDEIHPVAVEAGGYVDIDKLDHWLGELARSPSSVLLRMKGILSIENSTRRFVFNGVRTTVNVCPGTPWGSEPRYNRIVLIGKGLDGERLQAEFETFVSR